MPEVIFRYKSKHKISLIVHSFKKTAIIPLAI